MWSAPFDPSAWRRGGIRQERATSRPAESYSGNLRAGEGYGRPSYPRGQSVARGDHIARIQLVCHHGRTHFPRSVGRVSSNQGCVRSDFPRAVFRPADSYPVTAHRSRDMLSLLFRAARRADPASDADLLARFAAARDEAAFEALVARHGPLVLGVARRLLPDPATADDVFQTTFLALARRAGSFRRPEALAAWLHRT